MIHAEKKALLDHGSTASANADAATKFRREEHCVYVRVCVFVCECFEKNLKFVSSMKESMINPNDCNK
jgi:hypothetical protein